MKRKEFIKITGMSALAATCFPGFSFKEQLETARIERLSMPPKHHFFGYYGVNPWDKSGTKHLALETSFDDHRPTVDDKANVGIIDKTTHEFTKILETSSFNLQQGSMLNWVDCGNGDEFTYNDSLDGKLISYAVNIKTGKKRKIDGPIASVSPSNDKAIGLDFQRMGFIRKVTGYAHADDNYRLENVPSNDGLYLLNLKTGSKDLILSIKDIMDQVDTEVPENQPAWIDLVFHNPTGSRLLFLYRIKQKSKWVTSLWTVNIDGSDLQCQIPFGSWISHFDWKDEKTILVTTDMRGPVEYLEFTDGKKDFKLIGKGVLTIDGHCSYLKNKNWIVSDTYPGEIDRLSELFLFNIERNKKISLGKFRHEEKYTGDIRCDLHPRPSKDGLSISFDSVHEGVRQIYTVDISEIIR
ncbi:hypothetical protein [Reichenbachiella sp. MALMAid0571]|uniref:hypothetical protein n=1 Tax=Reichenbachiella sp. MALMAid0571 TaxID=3143939 RepID=UPI0032DE5E1E